jgi:rhamnose transport system substrate-binding protein/rhamnose transport system permease protein
MLPKLINIDYFDACKRGAQKEAEQLGVTLIYDGPTEPSGSEQNKFIDTWIRQGVHAICIAPNQPKTIRWKLRALVGGRLPWYDLPEKPVGRGL